MEGLLWDINAIDALEPSSVVTFNSTVPVAAERHIGSGYVMPSSRGIHIRRDCFDKAMLEQAMALGVEVLCDRVIGLEITRNRATQVRLLSGTKITARHFLDGSGRRRAIGRHLSRNQSYSPPMLVRTGVIEEAAHHFTSFSTSFSPRPRGWLWCTPSIYGYFTWTKLFLPGDRNEHELRNLTICSSFGSVKTADARWRISQPLDVDGVLLIGEASGYLDPAWGQGVLHALQSGILAAKTVIASICNPKDQEYLRGAYDKWRLKSFLTAAAALRSAYVESDIQLKIPEV